MMKRIAIFYDGTFFFNVSNYYKFNSEHKTPLTFTGFHTYIKEVVASYENVPNVSLCQIVEAHFFRGRFTLASIKAHNAVDAELFQDQLLMYAGIVSHTYPMNERTNPPREKGIDVWLALEAYDLAVRKPFDICVLFAGDQDYVPLVRKMNSIGVRVLVPQVSVNYKDRFDKERRINTSGILLREVTYVVDINEAVKQKETAAVLFSQ